MEESLRILGREDLRPRVETVATRLDHMFAEIGRPVSQYAGLSRVAPGVPAPSLMHRRRILDKSITYVGLDVHKDTIAVALAEAGGHSDGLERSGSEAVARWQRATVLL